MANHPAPVKTFICYARQDLEVVDAVKKQLAVFQKEGLLQLWSDGQIKPGEEWDKTIKSHLNQAQLILLFVSVDFINSDYIEKIELKTALERHARGEVVLVPIIVRQCHWKRYFDIGQFQALPKGGNPIQSSHFRYPDDAYFEVSEGVEAVVEELRRKNAEAAEAEQQAAAQTATREQEEKRQQLRTENQRKQDDTAWATAVKAAQSATTERQKILAYEVYLEEDAHTRHRDEAEQAVAELKEAEVERKIAERLKKEATPTTPEGFVLVKGGTFQMGDLFGDGNEKTTEKPHTVTVDDFYLAKHALTFAEYDAFCTATKREKPSDEGWGRNQRPAINVSWYDAVEYCNWRSQQEGRTPAYEVDKSRKDPNNQREDKYDAQKWLVTLLPKANGYRLPTEAEWEYAAREGGKKVRFGNGRDVIDPSEINFNAKSDYKKPYSIVGEYRQKTVPVNDLSANALGLYQMSGNVWEWCWDWYGDKFYTESDGARNPRGPSGGAYRVLRGGSWLFTPQICRAAHHSGDSPSSRNSSFGFRLASPLQ
jgi:formylglycine-generating enzyme required for sulfatase activity